MDVTAARIALIIDGVDGYFARRYKVKDVCRGSTAGSSISRSTTSRGRSFPPDFHVHPARSGAEADRRYFDGVGAHVVDPVLRERELESVDYYFYGFPAAWNIVAVILYVLQPGRAGVFWVVLFILLTIVPFMDPPFR